MCCSALEIEELKKPAGPPCPNCLSGGGCRVYFTRPQVCREFECEWLRQRDLSRTFRPDKIGVIFMEAHDANEYRAVCAPERPLAWRQPRVFAYLVSVAKTGRVVVAKAGLSSWRIFESGSGARPSSICTNLGRLRRSAPLGAANPAEGMAWPKIRC